MAEADLSTPLLDPSEPLPLSLGNPVLCILGSGDFSRSLSGRLVSCGFRVVVGSRDPSRVQSGLLPEGVELKTQRDALNALSDGGGTLVFLAVYPEHYPSLLGLRPQLTGKTLVDVSNATTLNDKGPSNAERLAEMFPNSSVVKGFNVLSAWTLLTGAYDGSRRVLVCGGQLWLERNLPPPAYDSGANERFTQLINVLVCGDCSSSKSSVLSVVRRLGFSAVDVGGLCGSKAVEEVPLQVFPSWRGPLLTTMLLFLFFYLYSAMKYILLPYLDHSENNLYHLPLVTVNRALPAVSLVTLALVYLPGLFASVLQLCRGTKYKRFPDWLDHWICVRKQLGLMSFLCAALHAVFSLCLSIRTAFAYVLMNAAYHQVKTDVANSWQETAVWRSDLYLSSGILGLGVLCVLALTSLPSVGHSLNWGEFTFVQSGLGYTALFLSVLHVLFFGWDFAFDRSAYRFFLPPVFLLSLILPCCVLIGRLLLLLPCCACRLNKIRRGWESKRHRRSQINAENGQVFGDC